MSSSCVSFNSCAYWLTVMIDAAQTGEQLCRLHDFGQLEVHHAVGGFTEVLHE